MKTDENYIYPATPEELSAFYGWECETRQLGEPWVQSRVTHFLISLHKSNMPAYRIPLPTLSDLRVGDVVREGELTNLYYILDEDATEDFEGWQLLISRNTWVKVKV